MNKSVMIKALLLLSVLGLVACGGDNNKKQTNSSSSASSSSVASNIMLLNTEYPFTDETRITNTGTTELVVTKKYYWDTNKTVVILEEGSATID